MTVQKVCGVILAAGASSRMKSPKSLLRIDDKTFLAWCKRSFNLAGVNEVLVVTGYGREDLQEEIAALNLKEIYNQDYKEGMFSSIKTALRYINDNMPEIDALLLLPVDNPLVRPATITAIYNYFNKSGNRDSLFIPHFLGKPGHPPLIGVGHIKPILAYEGEGGLQSYLENVKKEDPKATVISVADEEILIDCDTPEDYKELLQRAQNRLGGDAPTLKECLAVLRLAGVITPLAIHSWMVAMVALRIGEALNKKGLSLNLDLLVAAGLLHDLAKGMEDHASQAAKILGGIGFGRVADIVSGHINLPPTEEEGEITETQILYLADKYVLEDEIVPLRGRLRQALAKYKDKTVTEEEAKMDDDLENIDASENTPEANIKRRFAIAIRIDDKVKDKIGKPTENLLMDSGEDSKLEDGLRELANDFPFTPREHSRTN